MSNAIAVKPFPAREFRLNTSPNLDAAERPETVLQKIKADLAHYAQSESRPMTLMFVLRMILLTPGFQFVLERRLQEIVVKVPLIGRLLRRILWWATCLIHGSEIAIAAEVAGGLYIPHPYGIVVGAAKIGRNVSLFQNVTIGRKAVEFPGDPVIGAGAAINAGAKVIGSIHIGEGAVIGANAVVVKDVPAYAVAVGVPAKIVSRKSETRNQPAS